jgi:hypothetical protein
VPKGPNSRAQGLISRQMNESVCLCYVYDQPFERALDRLVELGVEGSRLRRYPAGNASQTALEM